ncbi:MAG: serine/threonine protein kinase [candidate division NC10 bacterium]|nr:serine/threonine protein kinase [candidate division NC10 bacterium]
MRSDRASALGPPEHPPGATGTAVTSSRPHSVTNSHASSDPPANTSNAASYAGLTPDTVLDALDSVGLRGDGRLLALNSYENRVYQVWMEDGPPIVVKFYRPARWSSAAILEEHAFTNELAEREIPVVTATAVGGNVLQEFRGFRFAVFPRRGGRAPELESPDTLEWMGRFIGRIHAVGVLRPFHARPTLDPASFGEEPREYLLASGFLPTDLVEPWGRVASLASGAATIGPAACRICGFTATATPATCSGPPTVPTSWTSTTAGWGRRRRTCGCSSRVTAPP